jgi:hypothetical protein
MDAKALDETTCMYAAFTAQQHSNAANSLAAAGSLAATSSLAAAAIAKPAQGYQTCINCLPIDKGKAASKSPH